MDDCPLDREFGECPYAWPSAIETHKKRAVSQKASAFCENRPFRLHTDAGGICPSS